MGNWGRGRFWSFFAQGIGLDFERTAFGNLAWCATSGNRYPSGMLSYCNSKFTRRLIDILQPQILILSGTEVAKRREELAVQSLIKPPISTFHYAHRLGAVAEAAEVGRVRSLISSD